MIERLQDVLMGCPASSLYTKPTFVLTRIDKNGDRWLNTVAIRSTFSQPEK
jgi:hypothetical protein